jgi:phosphoglycolate phosphatase-like HAD superfamily hydrolase
VILGLVRPTILLFDIDGTLISTGGAGRRAIERAFETRFGLPDACQGFSFAGMTDRAILRQGLTAMERPAGEADIDTLMAVYLGHLQREVATAPSYFVHPGIVTALELACSRPGFATGLGTGNVREGARIKLTHAGIFDRFLFGGFGCDHEARAELLRIGAERGALELAISRREARVVVIGDTPKDIAAAKAIGAESLAVGTGPFDPGELAACEPTHVFRNLAEQGALEALFAS